MARQLLVLPLLLLSGCATVGSMNTIRDGLDDFQRSVTVSLQNFTTVDKFERDAEIASMRAKAEVDAAIRETEEAIRDSIATVVGTVRDVTASVAGIQSGSVGKLEGGIAIAGSLAAGLMGMNAHRNRTRKRVLEGKA